MNIRERYCLPVRFSTMDEVVKTVSEHAAQTTFFEVWIDYIDDLDENGLTQLVEQYPNRIVFVFRRDKLEPPHMSQEKRETLLRHFASMPTLIDLDNSTQSGDIAFLDNVSHDATYISSRHDYEQTPANLMGIIDTIRSYNPDIIKVATYCHSEEDAFRLIELKHSLNQEGVRSIILGMGEAGKIARLTCDLWGNELVFAPESEKGATAPGQFTRQELEQIHTILGDQSQ